MGLKDKASKLNDDQLEKITGGVDNDGPSTCKCPKCQDELDLGSDTAMCHCGGWYKIINVGTRTCTLENMDNPGEFLTTDIVF